MYKVYEENVMNVTTVKFRPMLVLYYETTAYCSLTLIVMEMYNHVL